MRYPFIILMNSHLIVDDELYLFKDFTVRIQTNSVKIFCKLTEDISDKYVHNLRKIIELNKLVFKEKIAEFEKKFAILLEELVQFIAEVDLTVSNIKTAKKYISRILPQCVSAREKTTADGAIITE